MFLGSRISRSFRFGNSVAFRSAFVLLPARTFANSAARCAPPGPDIRNIGIIAHVDAGKTTTTERILYYAGAIRKIGNVDQGDTTTDFLPAERQRGITITSAAITVPWKNTKINIIDTPGHADFTFEVIRSLRVLDGAVTILDAVAGVEAQTEKVWHQAASLGIPSVVYINKMDRDGAGFGRTVREIVAKLKTEVAYINIPYFESRGQEKIFRGVVDVLEGQVLIWEDSTGESVTARSVEEADATVYSQYVQARAFLVETVAKLDETYVEHYLEFSDEHEAEAAEDANYLYTHLPARELRQAVRRLTLSREIVPVLCGASFRNIGVQPLLEAVVDFLPSPKEVPPPQIAIRRHGAHKHHRHRSRAPDETPSEHSVEPKLPLTELPGVHKLAVALAFKVMHDKNRGTLVFIRVYTGTLMENATVFNTTAQKKERISRLWQMHADEPREIQELGPGAIGVISGSKDIKTGDTIISGSRSRDGVRKLTPEQEAVHLNPIAVPEPVFFTSIEPRTLADRKGMEEALEILLREDPSLHLSVDDETGQTLLSGMGDLHLEIAQERLVSELKGRVEMSRVMVSYKETLLKRTPKIRCVVRADTGDAQTKVVAESSEAKAKAKAGAEAGAEADAAEAAPHTVAVELWLEPLSDHFDPHSAESGVVPVGLDDNYVQFGQLKPHLLVPETAIVAALERGALPALRRGGAVARLPLHSVLVNVAHVSIAPEVADATPLRTAVRLAAETAVRQLAAGDAEQRKTAFTMMEPLMHVRLEVSDYDVGPVTHDITSARNGIVTEISDASASGDEGGESLRFRQLAESMYAPPDDTAPSGVAGDGNSLHLKKVIVCEVPLREMIGYLKTLRRVTQGRGSFSMEFSRYQGVDRMRLEKLLETEF